METCIIVSEMVADFGGAPAQNAGGGRRRRRRKGGKDSKDGSRQDGKQAGQAPKEPSAAQVIRTAAEPERGRDTEEPLTSSEVAEMKRHFAFLQQYKRELKLKLNAQEDLLVNGRREPTHRGVCLHLLGKLELARVQAAVERLDPKGATKLLAGIVRFSPDINYVLLFLQCVQKSESHAEATAALSQALRRIEFSEVSAAQMKRVVEVLVEVLPAKELPLVLFGLLDSNRFREAFDRSQEALPEVLASIVVPLRAAHAVLLRGKQNPLAPSALARGCELLLGVSPSALFELDPGARRRLVEHGLALATRARRAPEPALLTLAESFQKEARMFGDMVLAFAAAELAAGEEERAKKTLRRLANAMPDFRQPKAWLDVLARPRVGRVARTSETMRSDGNAKGPPRDTRRLSAPKEMILAEPGFALDVQRSVWLWTAVPGRETECESFGRLLGEIAIPGVPHPVAAGVAEDGRPYLATPRADVGDRSFRAALDGVDARGVVDWCADGVALLGALAEAGARLPDFEWRRLSVSRDGRAWLEDPWGLERSDVARARAHHTALGRIWIRRILGPLPGFAAAAPLEERLESAATPAELLAALAAW